MTESDYLNWLRGVIAALGNAAPDAALWAQIAANMPKRATFHAVANGVVVKGPYEWLTSTAVPIDRASLSTTINVGAKP